MNKAITITGIPTQVSEADAAVFRSRLFSAYSDLSKVTSGISPVIKIAPEDKKDDTKEKYVPVPQEQYPSINPLYSFDQLILPDSVLASIRNAVQILKVESLVFDVWGLRKIEPNPKSALNFYGPPGTGKTLAAHAIAQFLNKKIIIASYAEIESKYHGDGPKNVKSLFRSAEQSDAILFIDEADSLLSKRLQNVTQGSEQAINSMRSQLLINLEQFHGVVIFATNLVQNYDRAFETRVQHVEFPLPDQSCRRAIWEQHMPNTLPLKDDISLDALAAEIDDICGRDIKNAVIQAAINAALDNRIITNVDILSAIQKIKDGRIEEHHPQGRRLTTDECAKLTDKVKRQLSKKKKMR